MKISELMNMLGIAMTYLGDLEINLPKVGGRNWDDKAPKNMTSDDIIIVTDKNGEKHISLGYYS